MVIKVKPELEIGPDLFERYADEIMGEGEYAGKPALMLWFGGRERGEIWSYRHPKDGPGLWYPDGMQAISSWCVRRRATDFLNTRGDKKDVRALIGNVSLVIKGRLADQEKPFPASPVHLIPCQDGVYDLKTGYVRKYTPDMYFTDALPWPAKPEGRPDRIMQLFASWTNDANILLELFALCLYRGYPLQKFFFLHGSGRNGKSKFLQILETLLGSDHVSNVKPGENGLDGRFGLAGLYRKLANIAQELDVETMADSGTIKDLTGDGKICADRKNRDPIEFYNYATMIFALNTIPPTNDRTDAFFRRVEIIDFPNKFEGANDNRRLLEDLTDDDYTGIFHLGLEALRKAYDRQFHFQSIGRMTIAEAKLKYSVAADTIEFFSTTFCELQQEAAVPVSIMRDAVNTIRRKNELPEYSYGAFAKRLAALGMSTERMHVKGEHTQLITVVPGLRFKSFEFAGWLESLEPFDGYVSEIVREKWGQLNTIDRQVIGCLLSGYGSVSRITRYLDTKSISEYVVAACIRRITDQGFALVVGHIITPPLDGRLCAELRHLCQTSINAGTDSAF